MKKFTIIELLVVIAIIGILASMLMPALAKSRTAARQAVCLSTQKQVFIAFSIYIVDNNGFAPDDNKNNEDNPGNDIWPTLLNLHELKTKSGGYRQLRCPEGMLLDGANWGESNIAMNGKITNQYKGQPAKNVLQATASETLLTIDSYKKFRGAYPVWMDSAQLTDGPLEENIARHSMKANLIYLDGSGKTKSHSFLLSKNDKDDTFWNPEQ